MTTATYSGPTGEPSSELAIDPLIGQLIEGRYHVLARLGRGGMGAVYRVEHTTLKKELALKLLLPELGRSAELVRRFEREAEAAARLSHPNIIAVTDFGHTADGQLFLVMELLEGPSLAEVIGVGEARRPLGMDRALHIIRQILRALEHAHHAGVVHRDLKPDNILLVERDGAPDVVKLFDFGIAKLSSGEGQSEEALTQAGMIYGTPEYLSPEQALGEPADHRADLYAAGVILYEMLSGRRPFESDSKLALVSMHITQRAIPMVELPLESAISAALSEVVERAMEKRREDRWPDAVSFLAALDTLGSVAVRGRAVTLWNRVRRTARGVFAGLARRFSARGFRWPRMAALGVLVAVIASAVALGSLFFRGATSIAAPSIDLSREERVLKSARSCKERKVAALEIIASGDRRHVGALEAARDRRGGFLGIERVNACMLKELEAGLRKLQEER